MQRKKIGIIGLFIVFLVFFVCFIPIWAEVSDEPSIEPFVKRPHSFTEPESSDSVVSINVNNGDLKNVLNSFSQQTGKNIVIGREVEGKVTMRLQDVSWKDALEVVLRPYGYAYQSVGDTIIVNKMEKIKEYKGVEPLVSKVFHLRYLNASDIENIVQKQLSERGSMSILEIRGQKGWEFKSASGGSSSEGGDFGKRERVQKEEIIKSKAFVVTDVRSAVSEISKILEDIDQRPKQILIETRFMEVNRDKLKDIGLDYATGANGVESSAIIPQDLDSNNSYTLGGGNLTSLVSPSNFAPNSEISGTYPYDSGLSVMFEHLTGTEYQILLHMLEENVSANILSAPRVLTLNNQEATILVGTKYPILESNVSGESSNTSTSLDYYQDIGIQLNVVPQICADNLISLIIHPAVTSQSGTVAAKTEENVTLAEYPIITSREAETQVILESGETIAIGGLLKEVDGAGEFKVPILGDIPLLGVLFKRKTEDKEKIDLLIFITAKIIEGKEVSADVKPSFEGLGKEDGVLWKKN